MTKVYLNLVCLTGILVAPLWSAAAHANTDATRFLNGLLSEKKNIKRHRTVQVEIEECHTYRNPGDPSQSDRECSTNTESRSQNFAAKPKAISSFVVDVRNLQFHQDSVVALPSTPILSHQFYRNCADDTVVSGTVSLSVSGTEGYSVTKSKSVGTTMSGSVTMHAQLAPLGVGGGGSTTFSMSRSVSLSDSETENHSEATTRTQTYTVSIPKKSIGTFSMLAYQTTIDLPFSATVIVDGKLEANDSKVKNASDLLTEAERSMPFEGIVRMTNVSEGVFQTDRLPGNPQCDDNDTRLTTRSEEFLLPPGSELNGAFRLPQDFYAMLQLVPSINSPDEPTIGSAEGVHYQVMASYPVQQPDPQCGFNDLGVPKSATYRTELRNYTNYVAGKLIASWSETVSAFEQCDEFP
ncbi:hypothetical protein FKO01_04955 [Mesorhizobium sp. B2-3-3]|nr:hypothetical protein FKO01_04955 [Mesorhizobium sp. B2-3-3]